MILADRDIKYRLAGRGLVIEPLDDPEHQIQPASVDLRLGDVQRYQIPLAPGFKVNGLPWYWSDPGVLEVGAFTLATTLERVRIPADLVAQVNGKSSLGRKGLSVHITAGFIDPGFEGQITLELHNCSATPIILKPGMYICQLVVQKLLSPCERPYGDPSRKSRYQGQVGVTPSKEER
jgi:dCTP deaminase